MGELDFGTVLAAIVVLVAFACWCFIPAAILYIAVKGFWLLLKAVADASW